MNRSDANYLARRIPAVAKQLAGPALAPSMQVADNSPSAMFDRRWEDMGGPELVQEFRFDAVRQWRFDRAHLAAKVAIEIDGGVWVTGRHNRASGYIADCTKLNAATALGWAVFRLTPSHLDDGVTLALIQGTIAGRLA